MSFTSISVGVPTASNLSASAIAKQNKTTLETLLSIQKSLNEFKDKIAEMDEEMRVVKLENRLLKNKINELTSVSSSMLSH
jgi:regulator of replication initiation timing